MDQNRSTEWIPRIGMEFETIDAGWEFWNIYAGKKGFNARKFYNNRSHLDGKTTSTKFVCSHEGVRSKDKRDNKTKFPRLETRTGCSASLILKLVREQDNYKVSEFISEHNHMLQLPQACYLLPSQRKVTEIAAIDIDLADNSGIRQKAAHELMGRQVDGVQNLGHTRRDINNYLRDKRKETLVDGEGVAIFRYFCQKIKDNSSFQHFEQVDDEGEIGNIFWADAQMVIDYAQFGDVIIFDTTHGTNKENRPFGVFVGLNHFREIVIFGAVLLYDQTIESFKWVFDTFLKSHSSKQPKTIFTDQDAAMGVAIAKVMPNVAHGLCTWHIMENAARHLLGKKTKETNYVKEFSDCVYTYEDEVEFEKEFKALESKLGGTWFPFIYKEKKKWAYCYTKNNFSLGVQSTQLSESLNKDLKRYLKSDMDIVRFFENFERVVKDKREKEVESKYERRRKTPMVKMKVPILIQMSSRYTPKIFHIFQSEYELSMAAQIEGSVESHYIVTIHGIGAVDTNAKCCKVYWNAIDETVLCSCKMFERWGVLCCHALKVLDMMNIKLLPEKYVLKRWTFESRICVVRDNKGTIVIDTKLDSARRNRDLCRKFTQISAMASESEDMTAFLDGVLDQTKKQIVEKMQNNPNTSRSISNTSPTPTVMNMHNHNSICLKKRKEGKGGKQGKRHKSWVEQLPKNNVAQASEKQSKKKHASTSEISSTFNKVSDALGSTPNSTGGNECGMICKEHPQDEKKPSFTDLSMGNPSSNWSLPFYPLQTTDFSPLDVSGNEYVYPSSSNIMKDLNE